jgi:Flp pilus assembly protein TadB
MMAHASLVAAAALAAVSAAAALGLLVGTGGDRRATRIAALVADAAPVATAADADAAMAVPGERSRHPASAMLGRVGFSFADTGNDLRPWHVATAGLAAAGASATFLRLLLHLPWWIVAADLAPSALTGAWLAFRFARSRRRARFLDHFPDAIDLVARAVRAGLPLTTAVISVGRDVPDPVGEEFRLITDQLHLGVTFEEALWRSSARIGLADFRIFVVSLSLQRETGGSLAETLANLSAVIRRRKELRLKTKALSAEARASALVISALPFVAGAALAVINPDYARRFVTDPRGGYLLGGALAEIMVGIGIMTVMIKRSVK